MYSKVLIVCAVAAFAAANDIHVGTNKTLLKPFFEVHYEAQWAVTRPTKDVFVNTTSVISGINVTDLREAKDGEASIVSGGVGHNNVTISLKSPAVFRGYDFLVEVYADEEVEGSRDVEPSTPGVTATPEESKPTDRVTGTGEPSTESTDKSGLTVTSSTGKPEGPTVTISGKPEVTGIPVELTRVPKDARISTTGKPYGPTVTIPARTPEVTGVPKMDMEIPEEVDDSM